MNLKNFFTLTIRVEDYNIVADKPEFMKKLRNLTLGFGSGMNYELNNFEKLRHTRKINCQILTAYRSRELVGWALLSREPSRFGFLNSKDGFDPQDGVLFEVFVDPKYRKQGIASELLKVARRKANGKKLCVCPHDYTSIKFYDNFKSYNNKEL